MSFTKNKLLVASVAEYLADREQLTGAARELFLRLLRTEFGFGFRHRGTQLPYYLTGTAVTVAACGSCFEIHRAGGWDTVVPWVVLALVATALSHLLKRAQDKAWAVSFSLEWDAYCLVIRPVIVARKPGLLDRNRRDAGAQEVPVSLRSVATGEAIRRGPPELWVALCVGFLFGALVLLVGRAVGATNTLFFFLPLVSGVAGAFLWSVLRVEIFRRLNRP